MGNDMARQVVRDVTEMINMLLRDDEEFSRIDLPQGHESHDSVIVVNDAGLGATLTYSAEDTGRICFHSPLVYTQGRIGEVVPNEKRQALQPAASNENW
jgi:hypothetical protein